MSCKRRCYRMSTSIRWRIVTLVCRSRVSTRTAHCVFLLLWYVSNFNSKQTHVVHTRTRTFINETRSTSSMWRIVTSVCHRRVSSPKSAACYSASLSQDESAPHNSTHTHTLHLFLLTCAFCNSHHIAPRWWRGTSQHSRAAAATCALPWHLLGLVERPVPLCSARLIHVCNLVYVLACVRVSRVLAFCPRKRKPPHHRCADVSALCENVCTCVSACVCVWMYSKLVCN